jgi:hypothetical protein
LLSESEAGVGLGNDHDLVGRFFMLNLEHPGGVIVLTNLYAHLTFQSGENGAKYTQNTIGLASLPALYPVSYVSLSNETNRQLELPALRVRFQYPRIPEVDALTRLASQTGRNAQTLSTI